jgi:hypothetical protein
MKPVKSLVVAVGLAAALASNPVASAQTPAAEKASGAFRIDQIHYKQGATLNSEYVVIKNITHRRHILTGFRVVDPNDGQRYQFPRTILRAGRSVVLHTGRGRNNPGDRFWGQDAPMWNNDGDTALLKNRAGVVVDRCT